MGQADNSEAATLYKYKYGNNLHLQSEWVDHHMVKNNLKFKDEMKSEGTVYGGVPKERSFDGMKTDM